MFFYQEDEITPQLSRKIDDLIGKSIPIRDQVRKGTVGSRLYRLLKFSFLDKETELVDLNSRCTFEKFERGLLLRINDHQKLFSIAIPYDSIDHIELIKGEEVINPFPLSPMWILLKLGVPARFARYFMIRLFEYSIDPMILKIRSGEDMLELDSHGYNYYGEKKYFGDIIKQTQDH